jgi:hypothetical protein
MPRRRRLLPNAREPEESQMSEKRTVRTTEDPVCGMSVDPAEARAT